MAPTKTDQLFSLVSSKLDGIKEGVAGLNAEVRGLSNTVTQLGNRVERIETRQQEQTTASDKWMVRLEADVINVRKDLEGYKEAQQTKREERSWSTILLLVAAGLTIVGDITVHVVTGHAAPGAAVTMPEAPRAAK